MAERYSLAYNPLWENPGRECASAMASPAILGNIHPRRIVYVVVGCLCILIGLIADQFESATKPTQIIATPIGRTCFAVIGALLISVGLFASFSDRDRERK